MDVDLGPSLSFYFDSRPFSFLFVSSDEIISFRQIKPQMGERLDAEWIPDETPIFKKLAGTTGLELENKQMEQESSSQEEQKDDIEKEEETTLEVEQEKSEEKREDADQEMADDDSDEAAGKQEAAEQDRDMMDGDSPEDEEDPAESGAKSSQVSSMFKKILNLGSQSGQVGKLFSTNYRLRRCFGFILHA